MKKYLQVILLTTVAIILTACGNSDEKKIKEDMINLMQAIEKQDINTILNLIYTGEGETSNRIFIASAELTKAGNIKEGFDKNGGFKSVEVENIELDGDKGRIMTFVLLGNGHKASFNSPLIKKSGKWKFDSKLRRIEQQASETERSINELAEKAKKAK